MNSINLSSYGQSSDISHQWICDFAPLSNITKMQWWTVICISFSFRWVFLLYKTCAKHSKAKRIDVIASHFNYSADQYYLSFYPWVLVWPVTLSHMVNLYGWLVWCSLTWVYSLYKKSKSNLIYTIAGQSSFQLASGTQWWWTQIYSRSDKSQFQPKS